MALVAGTLINDAILRAFPFIREDQIAPGQLCRLLTTLDEDVVQQFAMQAPERLDTTVVTTVVNATNPVGYPLPAGVIETIHDFYWFDNQQNPWPVNMVAEDELLHPGQHPAGCVVGSKFFPSDPLEQNWTSGSMARQFWIGNGDTFQFTYTLQAARVTSLTATLGSPDEARDHFVAQLLIAILLNAPNVPPARLQQAAAEGTKQWNDLLLLMMKRTEVRARFGSSPTGGGE